MCGIAGHTHVRRSVSSGVLTEAVGAIRHRGPDQRGIFRSAHVSLGATRLRIQDLTGGDQPFHSADGNAIIVFNGEIYNQRELRSELEAMGRVFRTHCDTEVVLEAYLAWGEECFARLRGMFAIAIWSEPERRLVLARDRIGIKPLYVCEHRGELYFGSELKCIFADPDIPRRMDLNGLNCYLSLNYVPGPWTLVEGIRKLMPGHLLEWHRGVATQRPYVEVARRGPEPRTMEEACEELDGLMRKAVSEQLVSDVPLGVWLSGGLDSSALTHYASQVYPGRLKTFSITFRGRSFDEGQYIRSVSRHFGTDHTELDLNEDSNLADVIGEMPYYSDEPSADAGAVPVWYLAAMSRRDVTVALSGEGADELFGGYLTYQADRYNRGFSMLPRRLRATALKAARRLPASDEKIGFDYKLQRFLQGSLLTPDVAHMFWNGTFSEPEKRGLFAFANAAPMRHVVSQMAPGRGFERYLDFDQRYSLPDGLLYKVDRMSMAHAVEVRPPFLDERIVEFAARLPARFKISGRETKVVLRRLMQKTLPAAILRRPKIGFDIPVHDWLRGVLRPLLLDTLHESAVEESGLFHWPVLECLLNEHLERKANWGYHLWGLLTLMLWMRRWNVEAPATAPMMAADPEEYLAALSLPCQPASYSAPIS